MSKKNPKMAVSVVAPKELVGSKAEATRLNPAKTPEERLGMAAKVAESSIYTRNWKFKNADQHYPHHPVMRRVEKHFPYAVGGPLFLDEPTADLEIQECKQKALVMAQEGLRYCYITRDMTLEEVRKQLKVEKAA